MSEKILSKITAAWNELDGLCNGVRKFTMSIPVQPTDSDIVIGDALRFGQEESAEAEMLREALRGLLIEFENYPPGERVNVDRARSLVENRK